MARAARQQDQLAGPAGGRTRRAGGEGRAGAGKKEAEKLRTVHHVHDTAFGPGRRRRLLFRGRRLDWVLPERPVPRILSLIASATEIVCALGYGDQLVGRSHECDYPPEVRALPQATAPRGSTSALSSREIDGEVKKLAREAEALDALGVYEVRADALRDLRPHPHRDPVPVRRLRGQRTGRGAGGGPDHGLAAPRSFPCSRTPSPMSGPTSCAWPPRLEARPEAWA